MRLVFRKIRLVPSPRIPFFTGTGSTLSGTWRSSGEGFGGADDTIAAFPPDPKDTILDSAAKGSSGHFLVELSAPGAYTFFFDNSGLLRSTPRRVFFEAEFKLE